MAPINSIVKTVAGYTDDALRAVSRAKGKANVVDINGQVHTFYKNQRGQLHIIKDSAEPFYHTRLDLNTGDSFVRSVDRNAVLNHEITLNGLKMDTLPRDAQSINNTENIFQQFLKELLG